jgi:predicted metal-dependent hydrolase
MSVEKRERSFQLDGREVKYTLERRPRRGVTLQVEPRRGLRVFAPKRMPLREIDAILDRESNWIRQRLAARADWELTHPPRRFVTGEHLPLLGEKWPLLVIEEEGRKRPLIRRELRGDGPGSITLRIPAGLPEQQRHDLAMRSLDRWFRRLARELITARVDHWSLQVEAFPGMISIRDTRSRWGSCSHTGTLSFNWRVILAPPQVVDYLVVHELCHLVKPDHSPEFWELVESFIPGYKVDKRWLRDHGQDLFI